MRAYAGHVPLPRHLRLPLSVRRAQVVVQSYDKDLRLRLSVERGDLAVLERRIRRRPWTNGGMLLRSDMHVQARDGYLHIATVHPYFLTHPDRIIYHLVHSGVDVWARGGHTAVADELEYEESWAKITRRRRRISLYRDIAVDGFDTLSRMPGPDRSRISNAGVEPAAMVN